LKFLVHIEVKLPDSLPTPDRQRLLEAERERGRELVDAGAIWAIWRLPGGLRNVGIWVARDAAELDALLASLPLFPWLDAEITPLAEHPLKHPPEE
jgi:muconolactone D-isomerase